MLAYNEPVDKNQFGTKRAAVSLRKPVPGKNL